MTELSPVTQAVFEAAWAAYWPEDEEQPADAELIAAAALRAAADQVVPEDLQEAMHFTTEAIRLNKQGIRRQFLAIADELEAQ